MCQPCPWPSLAAYCKHVQPWMSWLRCAVATYQQHQQHAFVSLVAALDLSHTSKQPFDTNQKISTCVLYCFVSCLCPWIPYQCDTTYFDSEIVSISISMVFSPLHSECVRPNVVQERVGDRVLHYPPSLRSPLHSRSLHPAHDPEVKDSLKNSHGNNKWKHHHWKTQPWSSLVHQCNVNSFISFQFISTGGCFISNSTLHNTLRYVTSLFQ